jgi:N-methylhydantoinase B
MVRTSFSTLVRESYDFSCVITDEDGPVAGAGVGKHPELHRHLPETVKHFLRFFPPTSSSRATC